MITINGVEFPKEDLEHALAFYSTSPDGQYDDLIAAILEAILQSA